MRDIEVVRRTIFVISSDEPPQGGELERSRVQHSEHPTLESMVWKVSAIDPSLDRRMELSERRKSEIRPGDVVHQKTGRTYRIIGLAAWVDATPTSIPGEPEVGVYYRALQRSPHAHGFFWFRPLTGNGGWFQPSEHRDRFVRADKEHAAA